MASPVNTFVILRGCLPQLQTLKLCQVWVPCLCFIAPALMELSLAIKPDVLADLRALQHHSTLKRIYIDAKDWQYPNQVPFFLPKDCLVAKLVTKFESADLSDCLPSQDFCPAYSLYRYTT